MGHACQGSRNGSAPNSHPKTRRNYTLRSHVICDACDRRMQGKMSRGRPYYVCQPDKHHHPERRDWYPQHPTALWVREDDLLDLTHTFFTQHVLGPHREAALHKPTNADTDTQPAENPTAARLYAELADLNRRRQNLITQIEDHEPTGNPDVDRAFRKQLQTRYADLATEYETKTAHLEKQTAPSPEPQDDPTILDHLPVIETAHLTDVPEELLRGLYESFNLELRYRASDHSVTIRVTVKADRLDDIRTSIDQATTSPNNTGTDVSAGHSPTAAKSGTHVCSTPNGI